MRTEIDFKARKMKQKRENDRIVEKIYRIQLGKKKILSLLPNTKASIKTDNFALASRTKFIKKKKSKKKKPKLKQNKTEIKF